MGAAPQAVAPARRRVRIPAWAKGLWGLMLLILNVALIGGVAFIAYALSPMFTGDQGNFATIAIFGTGDGPFLLWTGLSALFATTSFATLGLSIAHLMMWSGIAGNGRWAWLAAIIVGLQPGMLVYWLVNVLREPKSAAGAPAH